MRREHLDRQHDAALAICRLGLALHRASTPRSIKVCLAGTGTPGVDAAKAIDFIQWVLGVWLVVHAGEEVGKALARGKDSGTTSS